MQLLAQLDPGLQSLITTGLTFVVGYLVLQLAALYPPLADYIGQYKVGIVTWLSGLVFNLLQNQLNQIPATWDAVAVLAMRLIVEVAAVLLAFSFMRARNVKGARNLK
jgi:hypothetical protein